MINSTVGDYQVQLAGRHHLDSARRVMLDTFYHVFGYGYRPEWHFDVIDLDGTYLRPQRHALFVATLGDEVVGTTAVRAAGPKSPPHPAFLVQRYPDATTAQLFRVYVHPAHRRRGLARALVEQAVAFVADQPGYRDLYLHTDTGVPGAEAFWRSVATPIHDARDGNCRTMHFEIPLPGRVPAIPALMDTAPAPA
ncbi:GNAT family N-acetyltransferase [Micromonospora sp. NPDC048830]|uniref:GNAT family N-acetyltransferase n=1 Tax=Micromonospora sp. NPDC048830 TaxID=3364257 RepID=UPI003711C866